MTTHPPGSEIGGYRIESLIGHGGMAVVYRAEDTRLGRKVALKLLSPQWADSDQFRQRFIRESRLAAALDHPNIVPIYDAGEAEGQLFIAMRYVVGRDLKRLLAEEGGQLPPDRTLRLFGQIGAALDAAHRAGLVHRDVKPGNILVSAAEPQRRGREDHVYLTDFGVTKRTSELTGGLTGTGYLIGTVGYVSPEQIRNQTVSPQTDIYELGCVLYECLTGQLPFRGEEAGALFAHLVESPPPVTAVRPELPAAVNTVVARAMAKEPTDRYESADELMVDLEQALDVSPAPGRPSADSRRTTTIPTPRWTEAHRSSPAGRDEAPLRATDPDHARTVTGWAVTPTSPSPPAAQRPAASRPPVPSAAPVPLGTPVPADAATTPTPPTAPTEPDTGHRALRNRWIVLVAGLVVLALAGAGTLVYRGLVHASVAHGSTTSASSATSTAATSPPTTATTTSAPATTTSTPSPTLSPPRPVTVRGTARWTDAGVPLVAGQTFVVHASGTVSYIQAAPPVGPDGDPQPHPASVCVLPGTAHHAGLIGRISASGTPFLVGSDFSGPAAGSGELFLGINDVGVDNNSGAFTATVQVAQP